MGALRLGVKQGHVETSGAVPGCLVFPRDEAIVLVLICPQAVDRMVSFIEGILAFAWQSVGSCAFSYRNGWRQETDLKLHIPWGSIWRP